MSGEGTKDDPGFGSRLVIGAVAGFVGTMAMTAAMVRMHRQLPEKDRYPLPPREIIDETAEPASDEAAKDLAIAGHFLYGAASGALVAAVNPRPGRAAGAAAGAAIWLGSYMSWIPAFGIFAPVTRHPRRRNLLMIAAHLVWGAATASAMRELMLGRETILRPGPDEDAP